MPADPKFVTYRLRLAIVGDVSAATPASTAHHDFVGECNRGRSIWFVRDLDALTARLAPAASVAASGADATRASA